MMRTALALSAVALSNAASIQCRLAALRVAISLLCSALIVGAPYQMSLSLLEPPGWFTVTTRTPDCLNVTFSTYSASEGYCGSNDCACVVTTRLPPSVRPG